MFWKNDFTTGVELSRNGKLLCSFSRVYARPEWQGEPLATREEVNAVNKKLNLILKEIGKEYVPEKDTTEPAKLVDLYTFDIAAARMAMCDGVGAATEDILKFLKEKATEKKKKRGRPKKK